MRQSEAEDEDVEVRNCGALRDRRIKGVGKAWGGKE